jgi:hypothetical protein
MWKSCLCSVHSQRSFSDTPKHQIQASYVEDGIDGRPHVGCLIGYPSRCNHSIKLAKDIQGVT